jgi:hypothetical protein
MKTDSLPNSTGDRYLDMKATSTNEEEGRKTSMRKNIASRINTDTPSIATLITGIKNGEIKVPQFQRKFVWKDDQALDLLDSLANNYPVGSLLLWRTKDKLLAERNIGEFQLPSTDDMEPTDYVLDGQQRLTVIYSCLGADEQEGGFAVLYDLEEENFCVFLITKRFITFLFVECSIQLSSLTSALDYKHYKKQANIKNA